MKQLFLLLAFRALTAHADTITEDFSTLTHFSSTSTAVWNLAERRGHLPYIVDDSASALNVNTPLDLGTGKDGDFSPNTYATFDKNASASLVTLDTSRTYEFTTFAIPTGVTLKGSGAAVLRIRVQGTVEVNGTIDLSGSAGADIEADTSQNPAGGSSGPGGGAGGRGGSTGSGNDGIAADVGNTGSGKGASPDKGDGGGGGGAGYVAAGQAGTGGAPGAGGAIYGDASLASFLGGSGGGGGASSANSSGAGGGGGGGALYLEAGGTAFISATGAIAANGGNGGGTASAVLRGGGGGGGSGGALAFFVGGLLTIDGNVSAIGGNAGPVGVGGGGAGGLGRAGRTRVVNSMASNWAGAGPFNPVPQVPDTGVVVFNNSGNFVLESASYDTLNSSPTYTSAVAAGTFPAGTTATLSLAGSSDGFASDDSGYVASTALETLEGKRYFKFRITLASTNPAASPDVRSVAVTFTPHEQGKFAFGFAGCARVSRVSRGGPLGVFVFLAYLISLPILGRRRKARR